MVYNRTDELEQMTIEQMKVKLKTSLSVERFEHSLGVMDTAVKLSERYGENADRAAIAGLLHDCARDFKGENLSRMCARYGIMADSVTRVRPELLHGTVGAYFAVEEYGIEDEAVLNAIRFHTMGRENMSMLEKIILISDYIEPGRDFPGVGDVRKAAFECLDTAVLMSFDNTIRHEISKGALVHPDTINARNYLILRRGINEVSI